MTEGKKSFILYSDLIHTFSYLTNEDAGAVFKWILDYVNEKDPSPLEGLLQAVAEPIKQQLNRDLAKYDKYIDKQKANGAKGGRPRKSKEKPNKPKPLLNNPSEPKKADNVNDNVNDTVNVNVIEKEKKSLPSYEEFRDFAFEKAIGVNISLDESLLNLKFSAWIENGWKDGHNNPIKNWKTKLLNTLNYLKTEKNGTSKNDEKDRAINDMFRLSSQ